MSPTLDRHVVTAVLVAHDGARWLPETLKALLTQTRPVQRLVTVDTGSRDRGSAVLAEVVGAGNVLTLPRTTGYGEAVAEALRHPAASLPVPVPDPSPGASSGAAAGAAFGALPAAGPGEGPGGARVEWIWLLHDDSAPAHDALAQLLRVADADPDAAVLGPKLRDWDDRRVLCEVGVALDGAARRETGLDRREFDQGQHDGLRDVMAVSSAGMLVRRDVWDRLGGFDVEFGLFREDADLCWRVRAAGHRVLAVTDAVVHHAEASWRGRREIGMTAESRRRLDRRNGLYTLLANLPFAAMLRSLARNVWTTLTRALFLLAVKRPDAARDELAALGDVLRRPGRMRRARAARADGRRRVHRSMRRFQPRRVALRRLVETLAGRTTARGGRRHDAEDEPARPEGPGLTRRLLARPGVLLLLVLTAVAVAAERSLITAAGRLGGGALVPAWGGASDLWAQYLSGWHPVGLGSGAGSPPYVGMLALLSTPLLGKPWLAVSILLLGSVPLAGLTAYLAARVLVVPSPRTGRRARAHGPRIPVWAVRVWFAAVYALLPAATGAIAGGRLGTAVVIVLLPPMAVQVARMFGLPRRAAKRDARRSGPPDPRRAGRAAWTVALLLTVAMAFVPLTWLLAALAGALLWALFGGPGGRLAAGRGRRNLVIALAVPPLLLLPWTLGLLRHPSRFLLEAGLHVPATPAAQAQDLLALDPGGPGTPARWTFYGLLLVAVCALPLRSRRTLVLTGWLLAIFGLLVAIVVSMATVTEGADRAAVWPGPALVFAGAGVLLAATAAVQRAVDVLAGRHLTYRAAGALVVLAALTAPPLAAFGWIAGGAGGPLGRTDPDAVPAFVHGRAGERTLVMSREQAGQVRYTVLRGTRPMLGESETPPGEDARRRMDGLVAGLAGGRAGDARALTRMGVQYVLVPRPASDPLTRVLDATPDLSRLSRTKTFGVWRLPAPAGRLMLLDGPAATPLEASGTVGASVRIPPGRTARTLLLAEPADGGWRASLDGREVKARTLDGWAQAYEIPPGGGRFELARGMRLRHVWVAVQGAALLAVVVLALPGARPEALDALAGRAGGRARGRRARAGEGGLARRAAAGAGRRAGARRARVRHEPAAGEGPPDAPDAPGAPGSPAPDPAGSERAVPASEGPAEAAAGERPDGAAARRDAPAKDTTGEAAPADHALAEHGPAEHGPPEHGSAEHATPVGDRAGRGAGTVSEERA
ncbi:glycosyltransferase [Actinomadura viridis]|uniref:glycosyltransferase n=1 Tax=Actinomadura viridis TaxID=58110 RepID=UPI0031F17262